MVKWHNAGTYYTKNFLHLPNLQISSSRPVPHLTIQHCCWSCVERNLSFQPPCKRLVTLHMHDSFKPYLGLDCFFCGHMLYCRICQSYWSVVLFNPFTPAREMLNFFWWNCSLSLPNLKKKILNQSNREK